MVSSIPQRLMRIPQWIVWRYCGSSKIPVCSDGRVGLQWQDPENWRTFSAAVRQFTLRREDGIGLVLTPDLGIVAVDYDDIRIFRQHVPNTYTELSPSGSGRHAFFSTNREVLISRHPKGLGIFNGNRWISLTGNRTNKTCRIRTNDSYIDNLLSVYCAQQSVARSYEEFSTHLSDEDVLSLASKNPKFYYLFYVRPDRIDDWSSGDASLCHSLAFWCGPDEQRIDALFRRSARMRPKWDRKCGNSTYGKHTIKRVLSTHTTYFRGC